MHRRTRVVRFSADSDLLLTRLAPQAAACVALWLARCLLGRRAWRPLEALSLAAAPLSPLVRCPLRLVRPLVRGVQRAHSPPAAATQRALLPPPVAAVAAALLRPLLLCRGVPLAAALLVPGPARTARLWAHLLPIYARYRLTGWRAGRAGRAARARALRGGPGGAGAPAGAGDADGAEAAAAEALWQRTHEAGGAAVHAMVLDLSVRWYPGAAKRLAQPVTRQV